MRVNIKHVSLFSAFKMGCAFALVATLFLGIPYFSCSLIGLIPLFSLGNYASIRGIPSILASGYIAIVLLGIIGAASVAISWTFFAFFYNVAAWLTGGLNVKLIRRGRPRSTPPEEEQGQRDDPVIQAAGRNLDHAATFAEKQKRKQPDEPPPVHNAQTLTGVGMEVAQRQPTGKRKREENERLKRVRSRWKGTV
jgi:hypothetical protein